MRIAIIENEDVVNVIIGDQLPKNGMECADEVGIGWSYKNKQFIAPPIVYSEDITE